MPATLHSTSRPPKRFTTAADGRLHRVCIRDVALEGLRLGAERFDLPRGFQRALDFHVDASDLRALAAGPERGRPADSRSCPGHEHHFALEPSHGSSLHGHPGARSLPAREARVEHVLVRSLAWVSVIQETCFGDER